ncbi:transposase [Luteimonas sp. Y-2-2-4F]|nr:transposase [Luteimonas sp. Y-2-2-4F]MCD9030177.1 transposase [Luteimonas sp. Y-2-2-4F]
MSADSPASPGHRALRRGRVSLPHGVYHVTVATWQRRPWFANTVHARAACVGFTDATALGDARLLAWVLMPDHAHWLLQLGERDGLSRVVARMKAAAARTVHRAGLAGPVWRPAFHDRALRREEDLRDVARYLLANPVRAGLVERSADYPFLGTIWPDV